MAGVEHLPAAKATLTYYLSCAMQRCTRDAFNPIEKLTIPCKVSWPIFWREARVMVNLSTRFENVIL